MYIEVVPNRNSPPAILLREGWREGKKIRKRTLANLTKWPAKLVEGLRILLRGGTAVEHMEEAFVVVRSKPHGHVASVLGSLRKLGLEGVIAPSPSHERNLAVAMIVARLIDPRSKLATARGLGEETRLSTLGEWLAIPVADEDALYAAMDWLLVRQPAIEDELAKRHLEEGGLVLYDVTSTYFEGHSCPLAQWGHARDGKKGKFILYLPEALRPCNPGSKLYLGFCAIGPAARWPWRSSRGIPETP
jgi:hypothetical protein